MSHKCFNSLSSCVGHGNTNSNTPCVLLNLDTYAEVLNSILLLYAKGGGKTEVANDPEFWKALQNDNPIVVRFTEPNMHVQVSTQNVTTVRKNQGTKSVEQLTAVFILYAGNGKCDRVNVIFYHTITSNDGTENISIDVSVEALDIPTLTI